MRNGTLVIVLLAVLLLVGLTAGGYFLLGVNDDARRRAANTTTVGEDDGNGETGKRNAHGGNTRADGSANHSNSLGNNPANLPATDGGVVNGPAPGDGGKEGPGETGPDKPGPEKPQPPVEPNPPAWKTKLIEVTVTGEVRYKADNRAAAGIKISAQNAEENPWGRWTQGNDEYSARMKSQPGANPQGGTSTDSAGKYTLKLTLTAVNDLGAGAFPSDGGKSEDRSGPDGDLSEYTAHFSVVATEAGFAPARSPQLTLSAGGSAVANLELAIPAAVRGRVTDVTSKAGIKGAHVEFHDVSRRDSTWQVGNVPRSIVTGDDGYFSVNDLPAARYGVSVWSDGYAAQDYWTTRRYAELSEGGEKDLGEIAMNQTATVTGRVVDAASGKPITGSVSATRANARWGGSNATCNEKGEFKLEELDVGQWTISATAAGYAKGSVEVSVTAGSSSEVGDIKLDKGFQVSGRVVDAGKHPVPNANVQLGERRDMGGPMMGDWPEPRGNCKTDADGSFSIGGLSEGRWQLDVQAEGYAALAHKFEVKQQSVEFELVLLTGGTASGSVRDAAGKALPECSVRLLLHGSPAHEMYKTLGMATAWGMSGVNGSSDRSDASGLFEIKNIPPGTYLIAAMDSAGGMGKRDELVIRDGEAVSGIELVIAAKGSVEVTVLEEGKAVEGIKIDLRRGFGGMGGNSLSSVTNANGVAVVTEVPEGSYVIQTNRDGTDFDTELMKKRSVVVKPGETSKFTLELKPVTGVLLHGKLTMNGQPLFTTCVLVGLGPLKSIIKQGAVGAGGAFEFRNLTPGKYELHARESEGAVPAFALLDLAQEGDFPFDKNFQGFVVSGNVSTPANNAAERSQVAVVLRPNGLSNPELASWLRGEVQCDSDGQFTLENVASGSYTLTATLAGVGSVSRDVEVSGADVAMEVSIGQTSGNVALKITKIIGKPVRSGWAFALPALEDSAGKTVTLPDPNETWMNVAEGTEKILRTLPPGTYTVVLNAAGYLPKRVPNVIIEVGKTASAEFELTAAAELRVTFTNTEITQDQCGNATITYLDATGKNVADGSSIFESFGTPPTFDKPTVAAQYIGPEVVQIRIKLAGFQEVTVPVQFEAGKLIAAEVTLVPG